VEEEVSFGLRARLANPMIVAIIVAIVVLITPAIMNDHVSFQTYTSITWEVRIEEGRLLYAYISIHRIFEFERYFPKYLFILMVYRYYHNKTTFVRTLLVGIISEIYLLVFNNLGNFIYTLFPVPGIHPSPLSDIILPFSVLTFLILVKIIPRHKIDSDPVVESWLEETDTETKNEIHR